MADLKATPPRLTGRIARHVEAIADARARGLTWRQIVSAVGPSLGIEMDNPRIAERLVQKAYKRAVRQIEKGKLRADAGARITTPAESVAPQVRPPAGDAAEQTTDTGSLPPVPASDDGKPAPQERRGFKRLNTNQTR